jgi:dihydroxy-acid dehydratase
MVENILQVLTMILGGSTNAVLHLIAIAHSVGIELTLDDFARVSDRTPFLADLKPSGKYVMEDVYKLGGIPSTSLLVHQFPNSHSISSPLLSHSYSIFSHSASLPN